MKKPFLALLIILMAANAFGQEAPDVQAPEDLYRIAFVCGGLGLQLGPAASAPGSIDLIVDIQFSLNKCLALGIVPDLSIAPVVDLNIAPVIGFGAWGGILFFPGGRALEGFYIKLYGGAFLRESNLFPAALASLGYQNIWGGFVFTPSIGAVYIGGSIRLDLKLDFGFAF